MEIIQWSHLLVNAFKVNEMAAPGDGEVMDTSSPKTSFKDYLELWEFLLEKGKFKVCLQWFYFSESGMYHFAHNKVMEINIYHV